MAKVQIQCKFCLDLFKPYWEDFPACDEGYHCAARIYTYGDASRLDAGYGSNFDLEIYEFVGKLKFGELKFVCDGCIQGFLEQGAIFKVADG